MPSHTVFYSWQSDLPNSVNRGFIEDCLQRALKELKGDETLELDPCLDRDTSGVPGSPDIAATIFEKIRAADLFVCDVSFINSVASERRTPNPNVLVELGYAACALGWDKVICVFNRTTGSICDLPFDIRQRRVRSYELLEGQEKAEQRKYLVGVLREDIHSVLHAPDQSALAAHQQLLSTLAAELIPIIICGEEVEERRINPWLDSIRFQFEQSASSLRELASTDTAIQHSLSQDLEQLAGFLDEVVNLRMHLGSWPEFSGLVAQAVDKAVSIKKERVDPVPLSPESLGEIRSLLVKARRQLEGLAARASAMPDQGRLDDLQSESSQIGLTLLRLGHYNVDQMQAGLGERLRGIGRDLHLVETMRVVMDGGRSVAAIVERVQKNSQVLAELVESIQQTKGR